MKRSKVLQKTQKISLGIALALGCSFFSVGLTTQAEAADMLESGVVTKMAADSADIVYDHYNAKGNFYIYEHDSKDVSKILGGNITVKSAEMTEGNYSQKFKSNLMLVTDSSGIDVSDSTVVHNVLNNLAGKLTYAGYVDGETNLAANAMIAEGITSSYYTQWADASAVVHFDEKTGKGYTSLPAIVMAKDSADITIDNYNEVQQLYSFSHDANDPTKIYGGNIILKGAEAYVNQASTPSTNTPFIILRTDASGIDVNNAEQVKNVLSALASKITFDATNKYGVSAWVFVSDGLTMSDWTYGYSQVSFDNTTGEGKVGYTTMNHVYEGVLTGDKEKDTAFADGYNLGQYKNEDGSTGYYFSVMIRPDVTDTSKDAVLAAINIAKDADVGASFPGGSSNQLMTSGMMIDVSNLAAPNGKVYAIYNGAGGKLDTGYTEGNL